MKPLENTHFGRTNLWWLVMAIGIILMAGGVCYWLFPGAGYAVASILFGWLLIVAGTVQICVSSGMNRPRGWGWWLAGGIIDLLIGFMLVRNVVLAESVMPYFMAFIFIYWGVEEFISASVQGRKLWWLGLINGVLLCIIGYFFIEDSLAQAAMLTSFLAAIAFIYWGFTMLMAGYEMKPDSSLAA